MQSKHEKSVDVEVSIPVDTPVGEYEVIAEAVDLKTNRQDSFKAKRNVVILFNPWDSSEYISTYTLLPPCNYGILFWHAN